MRGVIASLGAVLVGLAVTQVQAQAPSCSAHVDGQWQPLDADSLMSCLASMDRSVPAYNAQGFKFGLWGRLLLSGDRYYFYSSRDGGRNWQAVGLKTEVAGTGEEAPASQAAAAGPVVDAVTQDAAAAATAEAEPMPAPQVSTGSVVSAPAQGPTQGADAQATAPLMTGESVAMAAAGPTPAPAPAGDRRSCSVHVGSNWERVANLTLEECAAELDKSPDDYDRNGFKYAYWSGIFLAADATEILKSADSRHWERVLTRAAN